MLHQRAVLPMQVLKVKPVQKVVLLMQVLKPELLREKPVL